MKHALLVLLMFLAGAGISSAQDANFDCGEFNWDKLDLATQAREALTLAGKWRIEYADGYLKTSGAHAMVLPMPAAPPEDVDIAGAPISGSSKGVTDAIFTVIFGGDLQQPYIGVPRVEFRVLEELGWMYYGRSNDPVTDDAIIGAFFKELYPLLKEFTPCDFWELPTIIARSTHREGDKEVDGTLVLVAPNRNSMIGVFYAMADVRGITGVIVKPAFFSRIGEG